MLKQFFRTTPKWQSPKSQRRLEAIAEFLPEQAKDLDILVRMAREDSEPAVRREAIGKLHDLDLLQQIQRKDLESTVREAAGSRFNELLAGKSPHSPPITLRLQRIRQISSMQTLGYLIKEAQPIDIKIAAVEQISDEILLEGIALKSGIARLRQLAAERISNPRVLESLANQSRTGDKSVYRIAREKLDALHSLEKSRHQVQDRIDALCEAMEQHARSALNPLYPAKTESLLQQWQSVSADAEPAQAERFDTARDLALQIVHERQHEEQQRREQEQAAQEHLASCQVIEGALAELAAKPDSFDLPALAALLKTQELRWQVANETLAAPAAVRQRYAEALRHLQDAQNLMEAVQNQRELFESTIQSAQDATPAEANQAFEPLTTLVGNLPSSVGLPLPSILKMAYSLLEKQAMDSTEKHSSEKPTAHADANHAQRQQLGKLLDQLEQAIEAGNSKLAGKKLREAQQLTKQHHLHDNRLPALMHRVQEFRDWTGYAVLPKKEALLAEMKALAEKTMDPDEKADTIRVMQDAWKALGVTDPHVETPLWDQFKAASDHAYEPCRAHFAAQHEMRLQHALKREAICTELEQYLETLPESPAIKHLEALLRTARQEWQQHYPVERKQAQPLQHRFNKILRRLEALLKKAYTTHEAQKRSLITEAGTLLEAADNRTACNRIKELQQQWKNIEPTGHKMEQTLWKEFRAICDQVFAKRDTEIQNRKATTQASLEQAEALIAAQQKITDVAAKGESDHGQSSQLAEAFHQLDLSREQRQPLQKRFEAAQRGYEHNLKQARQHQQQAALNHFFAAFQHCIAAEKTLCQQAPADIPLLTQDEPLKAPWQAILEQRLAVIQSVVGDTAAREQWPATVKQTEHTAAALCLELEIMLDQPSPAPLREARLQVQMEMLQKNAFHRNSANAEQQGREKLKALLSLPLPEDNTELALMTRIEGLIKSGKLVL